MQFLGGKGGYFEKLSNGSKTSDMTSEELGEMFEGDSADMCGGKFPGVRTSIGVSRNIEEALPVKNKPQQKQSSIFKII